MVLEHIIIAFMVAAIVAPFSYYAGLAAKQLRLPQITGYLASGIICGPYVLGLLSTESLLDLNIIESSCLSIIGLAAGAELELQQLSKSRKQVLGITLGICAVSWVMCYAAFDGMLLAFPLVPAMDARHILATASLGATLMMTRSPASAIAVLKEMDGKGPFCSLVMAVVVVKDVIVIIAFALNIELIRSAILPGSTQQGLSMYNLALPLLTVFLAITIGVCGGLLLGIVLKSKAATSAAAGLTEAAGRPRMKAVLMVVLATAVFQISHYLDAEPLLACVTMGMVLLNGRTDRADKDREEQHREEVHHLLQHIMSFSNVAFFGLAGASLKLSALKDMFGAALVVSAVRLCAIYLGSWVGCYATSTTTEYRRLFWMSMVTQAGVAMGLARLAGTRFPDWGPAFQTFMMSIILVNLLVGPLLFRFALIRVGETKGQAALSTVHIHRDKEPSSGGATSNSGAPLPHETE